MGRVRKSIAAVPADKNAKSSPAMDAFGYFGAAYGVEFVAPLGVSTEDQPSAKAVARLIDSDQARNIFPLFSWKTLPIRG